MSSEKVAINKINGYLVTSLMLSTGVFKGDGKRAKMDFVHDSTPFAFECDDGNATLREQREHTQRAVDDRTRILFAKLNGIDTQTIITSLSELIELSSSHYFEVQGEDLVTLARLCQKYGRDGPELTELAHKVLSNLCAFPSVASGLLSSGLLGFLVNEIPEEWAIITCTRIAKVGSSYRDAIINEGALYMLSQNVHLVARDCLSFEVVCDFCRSLLKHEIKIEEHVGLIRDLLSETIMVSDSLPSKYPEFLKLGRAIQVAHFEVQDRQILFFVEKIEQTLRTQESQKWYAECAKYIREVLSGNDTFEDGFLNRCWNVILQIFFDYLSVESISSVCGDVLLLLVQLSPEVCISGGYAKAIQELANNASFDVKCALCACMASLFINCTQTQYRCLVLEMEFDLGMNQLIPAISISSNSGMEEHFATVVKGFLAYIHKMSILENREEIFQTRVWQDEDLASWIKSINPVSVESFSQEVIADCKCLHDTVKAILHIP